MHGCLTKLRPLLFSETGGNAAVVVTFHYFAFIPSGENGSHLLFPFFRRFTSKHVTQVLCAEEMEAISKSDVAMEDMTVRTFILFLLTSCWQVFHQRQVT